MTDDPSNTPAARELETSADKAFLATASHEIRTPLNGILGTVSLLLETELKPAQREYVEAIRLSGSRLLDMLNNVLDYARLDAGDIELENTHFTPAKLAREVVELLAPRAHQAGIDIAVRNFSALPCYAVGDAARIRQILFNLIGNALKFTSRGGVLIDVNPGEDNIIWSVTDTGPGIAQRDQVNLFNAFHQTAAGDAQKDGGVGLGLAIVKRLTGILGGTIEIESYLGIGSRFSLTLPIKPAYDRRARDIDTNAEGQLPPHRVTLIGVPAPTALAATASLYHADINVHFAKPGDRLKDPGVILVGADLPSAEIARLSAIGPTLVVLRPEDRQMITRFRLLGCAGWLVRPMRRASLIERITLAKAGNRNLGEEQGRDELIGARVLIADDNAVNTLIASRALEKAGFKVTVAATGVEALEAAQSMQHALILMDLRMPIMDGFEAMRSLRAAGHTTPIIAISAEINPQIEARARECGANAVAAKPLDATALRTLADNWASVDITKINPNQSSQPNQSSKKGAA